jgi:hypothetical protein
MVTGRPARRPVTGHRAGVVNQVKRNRDAGAYSVSRRRTRPGFGGCTWSALCTNAVVLSYRQTEQAEAIAKLAGFDFSSAAQCPHSTTCREADSRSSGYT